MRRLLAVASMSHLASSMEAAGQPSEHLWEQHLDWHVSRDILSDWLDEAAEGLAWAALTAATLLEIEAVLIDGWMPTSVRAELTARTRKALAALDLSGITPPAIREGTVGAEARSLGAVATPIERGRAGGEQG